MEVRLNSATLHPDCELKWYHGLAGRTLQVECQAHTFKVVKGPYSGLSIPRECADRISRNSYLRRGAKR